MIKLKIVLKIILVLPFCMAAQHKIQSYVIGSGATGSSSSTSQIKGTLGQSLIGSSGNEVNGGFWIQLNEITTDIEEMQSKEIPTEYKLYQNYPNPFNPSTVIKYSIPVDVKRETTNLQNAGENVRLIVYDVLGREVATLVNERQKAGNYEVEFGGSNVTQQITSGIYFYRLSADQYAETKKMILLK